MSCYCQSFNFDSRSIHIFIYFFSNFGWELRAWEWASQAGDSSYVANGFTSQGHQRLNPLYSCSSWTTRGKWTQFEICSLHDQRNRDVVHILASPHSPTVQIFPCCQDSHMTRLWVTWVYHISISLIFWTQWLTQNLVSFSSASTFNALFSHFASCSALATPEMVIFLLTSESVNLLPERWC